MTDGGDSNELEREPPHVAARPTVFTRVIAALQIVGSSTSAVAVLTAATNGQFNIVSIPILLMMYAYFVAAFLSGIALWNGEQGAYLVAMIVQALQVPIVVSSILTYKFIFGFGLVFSVLGNPMDAMFELGGFSYLLLFSGDPNFSVGLNFWPFITIAYLHAQRRKRAAAIRRHER